MKGECMKVLIINGSPREEGNTTAAIKELVNTFDKEKIDTEVIRIGSKDIRGCIGCFKCDEIGKCIFDDIVNETVPKLKEADGVIVATPVYYASANATLVAFLQRLFISTTMTVDKTMKVGASVAVCRRGGASSTFDELNKFFTVVGMPIASSQYWNSVHGGKEGEAVQDLEGMQTMRTLAKNMTFLMKSIEIGKKEFGLPEKEPWTGMNFIH
jgi:multimeric flavodoxin WrbA